MVKQLYETCDETLRALLEQCLMTRVPALDDLPGLVITSPSPWVTTQLMEYAVYLSIFLEALAGTTNVAVADEEGLHRFNSTEVYVWWQATSRAA
ncbi:hypothetical protein [Leptolyngbya sp. FACHB-261]|uniref:hypothetical protein n=1 Tax=Leptolyngbya sp. FACHB-261 TaxID=2692806 RepID=UPI0016897CBB|nr:hypothetical protein [Leptolyngbya sp. FACHB-261]MBD2103604.1 hypothetical protein [Leptolyngbya sp. FACHB-261]